jgi:hypothetical protein
MNKYCTGYRALDVVRYTITTSSMKEGGVSEVRTVVKRIWVSTSNDASLYSYSARSRMYLFALSARVLAKRVMSSFRFYVSEY